MHARKRGQEAREGVAAGDESTPGVANRFTARFQGAGNPGSHDAVREGCRCPMTENQFGRGVPGAGLFGQPQFIRNSHCALHGAATGWTYSGGAADEGGERLLIGVHRMPRLREVVR